MAASSHVIRMENIQSKNFTVKCNSNMTLTVEKNPNLSLMPVLLLVEMHCPLKQFHSKLNSIQANHPW
ncbi:MAG: hypothetical protein UHW60_03120 [Methanobrevibacter sp.]|nr:hypothetical protein [Methanobrevibacter sp.]